MSELEISEQEYKQLASVARRISPSGDVDPLHDAWIEVQNGSRRHLVARTKFRALDERRRLGRSKSLPAEERLPAQRDDKSQIDTAILAERCAIVGREINQLAPPYRDIVVLRWLYELSVSEISHRLGVPVKTIYTRLRRAETRLETQIQAYGDGAYS